MVMVVLLAMAVPVTLVVLAVQKESKAAKAEAITEALRQTLEKRADELMGPAVNPLASDLVLYAESPKEEAERIRKLIHSHGGEVILTTQENKSMRMMAQVPALRMESFEAAVQGKISPAPEAASDIPETSEMKTLSISIQTP